VFTLGEELLFVSWERVDHLAHVVDGSAIGLAEDLAFVDKTGAVVHTAVQKTHEAVLFQELLTPGLPS
jgi:hypothetical protein